MVYRFWPDQVTRGFFDVFAASGADPLKYGIVRGAGGGWGVAFSFIRVTARVCRVRGLAEGGVDTWTQGALHSLWPLGLLMVCARVWCPRACSHVAVEQIISHLASLYSHCAGVSRVAEQRATSLA